MSYVWVFYLHVFLCTHMHAMLEVSNPCNWNYRWLWAPLGAGNQTLVLCKSLFCFLFVFSLFSTHLTDVFQGLLHLILLLELSLLWAFGHLIDHWELLSLMSCVNELSCSSCDTPPPMHVMLMPFAHCWPLHPGVKILARASCFVCCCF